MAKIDDTMAGNAQDTLTVLIDGVNTRCVDFADRGLQYGDGVFTTLPVHRGVPVFLEDHLHRLRRDAAKLGLPWPGGEVLGNEARSLAAANPDSILKIMLTRGVGGRGYRCPPTATGCRVFASHPKPDYPVDIYEQGARVRFCDTRLGVNPRLAGIKHLNRLEQVLARAEWEEETVREGIMLDSDGWVVEGVMSNVFLNKDGVVRTPRLDRCGVAGVMREKIIAAAATLGIVVEEARLSPDEVLAADEVFLSNSVIRVWPVGSLGDREYRVGAATRMISARIEAMIAEEMGKP